eukprot:CAMPEP_0117471516 /NCGR_PEP_ID=MMETSP0784-20121206/7769_1 /TAXON_ID=39447 /ORGANISM="" /LENGTH=248 /DNA_ID=CAMNT_0005265633 /DNA_START=47 /DNA_END=790 /DNA_ORIENTATION=+
MATSGAWRYGHLRSRKLECHPFSKALCLSIVAAAVAALLLWTVGARFMPRQTTVGDDGATAAIAYAADWLVQADVEQLVARRCAVLFWQGGTKRKCSCADGILRGIAARSENGQETLLADANWRLIRDPKMKPGGDEVDLHYTAWSMDPDLHTISDLKPQHVLRLKRLYINGRRAVTRRHVGLAPTDLAVFAHFPPNIFRLHVHFVHRNASMWSPQHEVVRLVDIMRNISRGSLRLKRRPVQMHCGEW